MIPIELGINYVIISQYYPSQKINCFKSIKMNKMCTHVQIFGEG